VDTAGVTGANLHDFVARCDVVVDGVDVTELSGWRAKLLLHQEAARAGVPVLSGWDMAGLQYIRFYDYRLRGQKPLDGKISDQHLDSLEVPAILLRAVPARFAPVELIRELRANNVDDPNFHVPQLVYTAMTFGALSARMVAEILVGGRVRRHTVVDVHDVVRTGRGKAGVRLQRAALLIGSIPDVVRTMRRAPRTRGGPDRAARPLGEAHRAD
jgi:hypothetical protein